MEFRVRVLGSVFAVHLDEGLDATLAAEIVGQWGHLCVDDSLPAAASVRVAPIGGDAVADTGATVTVVASGDGGGDEVPDQLASRLTLLGLQELVGSAFMFHAAGLATLDGRVVALVGPSGRGKTTAARTLGQTLGYVTDETVAFTPDLNVIPYPKPLSIGQRPGVKRLLSPAAAGMQVANEPLRLATLTLLDRRTEPTEPALEHVDIIDALAELTEQTSSLARVPRPLQSLVATIVATGGVKRLVYQNADDLPGLVTELLATPPSAEPAVEHVDCASVSPQTAGNVGRGPFVDALIIDGRLAILTDRKLHVLDGIGPALWRNADDASVPAITEHLRAELGDPPAGLDIDAAVADAVTALVDAGLLQRKEA